MNGITFQNLTKTQRPYLHNTFTKLSYLLFAIMTTESKGKLFSLEELH